MSESHGRTLSKNDVSRRKRRLIAVVGGAILTALGAAIPQLPEVVSLWLNHKNTELAVVQADRQNRQTRAKPTVISARLEKLSEQENMGYLEAKFRMTVKLKNFGDFPGNQTMMAMSSNVSRWSEERSLGTLNKGEETELTFTSLAPSQDYSNSAISFAISYLSDLNGQCIVTPIKNGYFVAESEGLATVAYKMESEGETSSIPESSGMRTSTTRAFDELMRMRKDCRLESQIAS